MSDLLHPIALYVHWPFCISKCPYCDFNSHEASSYNHELWLDSYIKELEYFRPEIEKRGIKTIFFGGGTPSLMDPTTVKAIIDWARPYFTNTRHPELDPESHENYANIPKSPDRASVDPRMTVQSPLDHSTIEITLEANPTSVETTKLQAFYDAGVNRVSIGIQSLIEEDLKKLGRTHSPAAAIKAIKSASKIFDRYSFDLIYARENQRLLSWQKELAEAMKLAGGHISLYQLTIERGTPFFAMHQKGELILPENDLAADMYLWTKEQLSKLGYKRYEISNFALPGEECQHNLAYWNYDEYLGIGPGAHSRICREDSPSPIALMNYNKPDKWLNLVQECGSAIQVKEQLSKKEIIEEILMMGLRLEDGITDIKLQKYLGLRFKDVLNMKAAEMLESKGFVQYDGQVLKLTDKGLLLHSYIVPRLIL